MRRFIREFRRRLSPRWEARSLKARIRSKTDESIFASKLLCSARNASSE